MDGGFVKKFIFLNIVPFLIWILHFICQLSSIFEPVDLAMFALGVLLCMPIIFSVINLVCAKDEKRFMSLNCVFMTAHILGYYISGLLYINFISNDSESKLITNTFSFISLLYVVIISLICLLIKIICKKVKNK